MMKRGVFTYGTTYSAKKKHWREGDREGGKEKRRKERE